VAALRSKFCGAVWLSQTFLRLCFVFWHVDLLDVNLGDQCDIPGCSQSEHPIIFFDHLSFSGNQVKITTSFVLKTALLGGGVK
jgi:hypothetical protein